MSAAARALRRPLRLLGRALVYELRKVSVFRTGFVVREVLRGLPEPLVMIFVYRAMFRADGLTALGSFSYRELVHYLILVATLDKLIFHRNGLDLSEQIFEGYVTKYLVMPFDYFTLALGRWVQFVIVQLGVAASLFALGAALAPDWWPLPASPAALGQAAALVLLGSYCFFLTYFIVNSLAFWLDVVWTLLVMVGVVGLFVRGALIPVSVMPDALREGLVWLFPYWSLSAPIEIWMGRLGTPDFLRGLAILLVTAGLLEALRREIWRRGTRRYTGSGM